MNGKVFGYMPDGSQYINTRFAMSVWLYALPNLVLRWYPVPLMDVMLR